MIAIGCGSKCFQLKRRNFLSGCTSLKVKEKALMEMKAVVNCTLFLLSD